MLGNYLVAKVAVSSTAYHFDSLYSYSVPESMRKDIKAGVRVLVPFGKGNVKRIGFVERTYEQTAFNPELKQIYKVIEEEPLVNDELLRLIVWLKENTFCTYFDAYRSVVPAGFSYDFSQKYSLANMEIECPLTEEEQSLVSFLKKAVSPKEFDSLLDTAGNDRKRRVVKSLIDKGIIEQEDSLKRRVGDETVRMLSLTQGFLDDETSFKVTPKQRKAVDFLKENISASVKEICYATSVTQTILKNLVKNGVAYEYEYEALRSVASSDIGAEASLDNIVLSGEQQKAFDGIAALVDDNKASGALLYGVTGSGKTSVFIKLIEHTLSIGRTAIMLIPEISLTPQTVGRFRSLFGDTVAVIHSNLSLGQRVDEFKRLKNGSAKIAIGTRSAIFAPLENIGIIIIDEEGEHSYKSESSPRYHARDVAIQRCGFNNAVLLMASATPSLETHYYAQTGRYHFFELKSRYSGSRLPQVITVDMETERELGCCGLFSSALVDDIEQTLKRREQVILLLNRRGFSSFYKCRECRQPVVCPNCSIPLTYHKANDRLMCHYCGYSRSSDITCVCGCRDFDSGGIGTQKVEDNLAEMFPDARILRMDADTTGSRFAYEKSFEAFSRGEYDIMLGTQMIAKGIDFPSVTLVGVLSIDRSLYMGDYRSSERTFSLITQVVGRGGRGEKPGRAYLQTSSPDHYVIELGAKQDYKSFYDQEISFRKALIYPPFCVICVIGFSSTFEDKAREAGKYFAQLLKKLRSESCEKIPLNILGPSPYSIGRVNNKYRYRLILKCKNNSAFRDIVSNALVQFGKDRNFSNVKVFADMKGDIM